MVVVLVVVIIVVVVEVVVVGVVAVTFVEQCLGPDIKPFEFGIRPLKQDFLEFSI